MRDMTADAVAVLDAAADAAVVVVVVVAEGAYVLEVRKTVYLCLRPKDSMAARPRQPAAVYNAVIPLPID